MVWHDDDATSSPGLPRRMLQLAYRLALDLAEGQLTLRAMSLVYTTILSLIPLLAISFS
ncbi:MAG: ribonuclease BN, partial [Alphaproteobacteria bacterium]